MCIYKKLLFSLALFAGISAGTASCYHLYNAVNNCLYISDSDEEAENIVNWLTQYPNVRIFRFNSRFGQRLTRRDVQKLHTLSNLTSLEIEGNGIIDGSLLQALPHRLKKLTLSSANQLTNEWLSHLPLGLNTLKLQNCPHLDDRMFARLPRGLKKLSLNNIPHITDRGLDLLPQNLNALILNTCPQISDAGLRLLPETLEFLSITACNRITNHGFANLPKSLKKLIIRSYETTLRDDCLTFIQRLPNLERLDLWGCAEITDEALKVLRLVTPNLTITRW